MSDQLHPFQRDIIASGKYTLDDAKNYAKGQYDTLLADTISAGKWSTEEAQKLVADHINDKYGFNFGTPSNEAAESQEDFVKALATAPHEDIQQYALDSAVKKADKDAKEQEAEMQEAVKAIEDEGFGGVAENSASSGADETNSAESTGKLRGIVRRGYRSRVAGFNPTELADIRAQYIAAPVDVEEANLGVLDGLSMGTFNSAGFGALRAAGSLFDINLKPHRPKEGDKFSTAGNIAYTAATIVGDLPVYVPASILGTMAAAPAGPGAPLIGAGTGFGAVSAVTGYWERADALADSPVTSQDDISDQLIKTATDFGKGWALGFSTAGAGRLVAPVAKGAGNILTTEMIRAGASHRGSRVAGALLNNGVSIPAEAAAFIGVNSALEGHLPTKEEFYSFGALVGTTRLAGFYSGKARRFFRENGFQPKSIVTAMQHMPVVNDIVRSINRKGLLLQYGENSVIHSLVRNQPLSPEAGIRTFRDAKAQRIAQVREAQQARNEYVAEMLGLTRERYTQWAKVEAENTVAGVSKKRDKYGRPDEQGRVDEPIPSYENWLKGQLEIFENMSEMSYQLKRHASEARSAGMNPRAMQPDVDLRAIDWMKRQNPAFNILDAEQQAIIHSMGGRYDRAAQGAFSLQLSRDGKKGGGSTLGTSSGEARTDTLFRGNWGWAASRDADAASRALNKANGVDDITSPQAYSAKPHIISNDAKTQFVNSKKEREELAQRFFDYMNYGKGEKDTKFESVYGASLGSQTDALFREMPLEFQRWVRQGKGVSDGSKASEHQKKIMENRRKFFEAKDGINRAIKDVESRIPTPEKVAESILGKDRIAITKRNIDKAQKNIEALEAKDKPKHKETIALRNDELKRYIQERSGLNKDIAAGTADKAAAQKRVDTLDKLIENKKQEIAQMQREDMPRYTKEIEAYKAELKENQERLNKWMEEAEHVVNSKYKEQRAERDKLLKERADLQDKYDKQWAAVRKNIEDAQRKYYTPDMYNPGSEVQVLASGNQFFILDPAIVRTATEADFKKLNVFEAADTLNKGISTGEVAGLRVNPAVVREAGYSVLVDRSTALNRGAKPGEVTIPYLAARMYAGVDGIINHWLEFGRTIFDPKNVRSTTAGMNVRQSGGLSLQAIRNNIGATYESLDKAVQEALQRVGGELGASTQKELLDSLALAVGTAKKLKSSSKASDKRLGEWLEQVNKEIFKGDAATTEAAYWNSIGEKDSMYIFRVFATAKHAQELRSKGLKTGFNDAAIDALADNSLLNKVYKQALDEVRDYQHALLDTQVRAGMITAERAASIKAEYKNYIPFERVQNIDPQSVPAYRLDKLFRKGDTNVSDMAQAALIIDPIEALARSTYSVLRAAHKNEVIRLIGDQFGLSAKTEEGKSLGTLFDWHVKKEASQNIQAKQTIEYFVEGKKVVTQVDNGIADAASHITRATEADMYSHVVMKIAQKASAVLRAGTTLTVQFFKKNIERDSIEAFVQSESGFLPVLSSIEGLQAVMSYHTGGALFPKMGEYYREWMASQGQYATVVGIDRRPMQEALNKLANPKPWRSALSEAERVKLDADMLVANRKFTTDGRNNFAEFRAQLEERFPKMSEYDRDMLFEATKPNGPEHYLGPETLQYLQKTLRPQNSVPLSTYGINSLVQMLNPKNWLGSLQEFSSMSEEATRIGEYIASRRLGRTMLESGYMSREITLDFARMGSAVQALNSISTFLNANIQGPDRFLRQMRKDPLSTMARVTSGLIVPSFILALMRAEYIAQAPEDDPLARNLRGQPDWEKQTYFTIPVPGLGTAFKMAKPFTYASLYINPTESFVEYMYKRDPKLTYFQNMINDGTIDSIMSEFWLTGDKWMNFATAQIVNPVLDLRSNFNSFTGQSIIPASMLNDVPYTMYNNNTTELAKEVSYALTQVTRAAGIDQLIDPKYISPIGIEHIIKGYTGALGKEAWEMLSGLAGKAGLIDSKNKPMRGLEDVPGMSAFVIKNPGYNVPSVRKLFNEIERLETNKKLVKRLYRENTQFSLKAAEGLVFTNNSSLGKIRAALAKSINAVKAIEGTDWDPDIKFQEQEKLIKMIVILSEEGLKVVDQIKEQSKEYWEHRRQQDANTIQ